MTETRAQRISILAPVLAAYLLYGVSHERLWMAIPALVLLAWAVMRGMRVERTSLRLILVGVGGALLGSGALLLAELPDSPFPPAVISPLCGSAMALAAYCVLSRSVLYAWTFAWVLAVVASRSEPRPDVMACCVLLLICTLFPMAQRARLFRTGLAGVAGVVVFSVAMAGAVTAAVEASLALEGTLTSALYRLLSNLPIRGGVALQDDISLLSLSAVEPDDRPLMELDVRPARLRTTVLEGFDGSHWRASPQQAARRPSPPTVNTPRTAELLALEDLAGKVPAPAGTVEVRGTVTVRVSGHVFRGSVQEGKRVTLIYDPDERIPALEPPGPELLDMPQALSAELAPLALEILGGVTDHRTMAEVLQRHFSDGFMYSLSTDLRGKGHPLAVLIREKRPAYCVYFASAMAALLRVRGVPARVVGGFIPEDPNPITGRVTVREKDAHAWVEAWLPDHGWMAFDPTPWRGRPPSVASRNTFLATLWDAAGAELRRLWVMAGAITADDVARAASSPLGLGTVAALMVYLLRRLGVGTRRPRIQAAKGTADVVLRKLHARYLKLLARSAQLQPAAADTDDDVVARLVQLKGARAGDAAKQYLAHYRRARFREDTFDRDVLEAALKDMERALKQQR